MYERICVPRDTDVLSGDIVEIRVRDGSPNDAEALHVLVRPAHGNRGFSGWLPDVAEPILTARSRMIGAIREFFLSRGFVEFPTPSLVPSPGLEPHLAGFSTRYFDDSGETRQCWLPTSPEFALKRALCAGFDRVFEIRSVFRNRGEMGPLHHPEFTMLEWYRAFADYRTIMDDTQELVGHLARTLHGEAPGSPFRGVSISWDPPYPRVSVAEAFRREAGIDLLHGIENPHAFRRDCLAVLSHSAPDDDFDTLFFRVMLEIVEPRLGIKSPVLLYDYPASMAALSLVKQSDRRLCERFELYVAGVELANAFSEVNDPREMALRIRAARMQQRTLGMEPTPADGALLRAMRQGMPPAGGIAVGLDRLLMALLGRSHLAEVMPLSLFDDHARSQRLADLA